MCETLTYRACISAIIRLVLYFTVTHEDQSYRLSPSSLLSCGIYAHSGSKPRDHCAEHLLGLPRNQRAGCQGEFAIHDAIDPGSDE